MKKIYMIVTALSLSVSTQAQNVVDFESYTLSAESYDNGAPTHGDHEFDFGPVTLGNYYDTSWGGWWKGFSISNMTDVTTSGLANQFSSWTGNGYDNSNNYAVGNGSPKLWTDGNAKINSFRITNTTYAALSMRDGDNFGKQFGSPNDANGQPDGTNGEDYFRVWIIGSDLAGNNADSIEFYLADYRFADSTQDYILDEWEEISFDQFSFNVESVSFRFESSDTNGVYNNTPEYFALDQIAYEPYVSLNELSLVEVTAYPNPVSDILNVKGATGSIQLFAANGTRMLDMKHEEYTTIDMTQFDSGIYLLEVSTDQGKRTFRILK